MKALSPMIVSALLLLTACKQGDLKDAVPALLSTGDEAGRQEVQAHIAEALFGQDGSLLLADDALTNNSELVVERRARRDPAGKRLPGRILSEPERFRLALRGNDCILLHLNSGRHWTLNEASCLPRPKVP